MSHCRSGGSSGSLHVGTTLQKNTRKRCAKLKDLIHKTDASRDAIWHPAKYPVRYFLKNEVMFFTIFSGPKLLYIIILLLLLTTALLLLNSCGKRDCANCGAIPIQGIVYDSVTKGGIPGVKIKVSWYNPISGSVETALDSMTSDARGNFHFRVNPGPSFFENQTNALSIHAFIPPGYATAQGIYATVMRPSKGFENLQKPGRLEFALLKKTNLTIHLQRTGSDNFDGMIGFHGYKHFSERNDLMYSSFMSSNGIPPSSSYTVDAAAGIYTHITLHKIHNNRQSVSIHDSVLCSATGPNAITINY